MPAVAATAPPESTASVFALSGALFSFSDAVSLYQKQVEHTHRFWNYLWLVASATLAASIAWANATPGTRPPLVPNVLLAAFALYALVNFGFILAAHRDAVRTSRAIEMYVNHHKDTHGIIVGTHEAFHPVLERSFRRFAIPFPLAAHLCVDAGVLAAVVFVTGLNKCTLVKVLAFACSG